MNGRKSKERARRIATELRRAARFRPHDNVGVMFGHCTYEADIEALKKTLHDSLIRMMGERRTGGVQWIILSDQDARDFLTQMGVDGEDATVPVDGVEGLRPAMPRPAPRVRRLHRGGAGRRRPAERPGRSLAARQTVTFHVKHGES